MVSVATAQLSGNLAGRILPAAAALSASMLRDAGVETGDAVAAFGASTALQLATTAALPVLALPAFSAAQLSTTASLPPRTRRGPVRPAAHRRSGRDEDGPAA